MSVLSFRPPAVAIIGGGFTGSLFALKLASACPDWTITLIEDHAHPGRGLAYGACGPHHLLNVPVSRMEVGLRPAFAEWLGGRPGLLAEALEESEGVLDAAFVPRQLFGDYIAQRLSEALASGMLRRIHGEVLKIDRNPRRLVLSDGSHVAADTVVLATGNLPSRLPFKVGACDRIVTDPWRTGALHQIQRDDSLLLLGTGLTMVDMLLTLRQRGHKGPIHAVSRHGLLPKAHSPGRSWPAFLDIGASPREAFSAIRANIRRAEAQNIPWQRVFDAARPVVASLWRGWTLGQRAQFLRHLRTRWDVHRHRMAERIAAFIDELLWNGFLTITAGRVLAVDEHKDGLTALIRPRGKRAQTVEVDALINCTGPAIDLRTTQHPLLGDLLRQGLVRSDPLGLGLETADCAALGADGARSDWLFALGPLTRPAWWEITAVPEINAQVDRLVHQIARHETDLFRPLTDVFLDIGAGI